MATTTVVRQIKGEPYWLTPGTTGSAYKVTSQATRVTHYVVLGRNPDGTVGATVESCSCPDHHHRQHACKHMAAVQEALDEQATEVQAASLEAPSKPTLFRFAQLGSGRVRIERWDGAALTERYVLPHATARSRWQHLWKIGYRPIGYMTRGGHQ